MTEVWKPISGLEGRYEVSSLGRIRSLDRLDKASRRHLGKALKPFSGNQTGYLAVTIDGKREYIHRLVLETFVGACPAKAECCHNDGDLQNNTVDNLRWDTSKHNKQDKRKHDPGWVRGERNSGAKLTRTEIYQIRNLLLTLNQQTIADLFNVRRETISRIHTGQRWGWLK